MGVGVLVGVGVGVGVMVGVGVEVAVGVGVGVGVGVAVGVGVGVGGGVGVGVWVGIGGVLITGWGAATVPTIFFLLASFVPMSTKTAPSAEARIIVWVALSNTLGASDWEGAGIRASSCKLCSPPVCPEVSQARLTAPSGSGSAVAAGCTQLENPTQSQTTRPGTLPPWPSTAMAAGRLMALPATPALGAVADTLSATVGNGVGVGV